jgi:hypothetical protein
MKITELKPRKGSVNAAKSSAKVLARAMEKPRPVEIKGKIPGQEAEFGLVLKGGRLRSIAGYLFVVSKV